MDTSALVKSAAGIAANYFTGGAAGLAMGAAGSGMKAETPSADQISQRSQINVAPIGVNLGAILQPYNSGSSVNGGTPMNLSSPFANIGVQSANKTFSERPNYLPIVLAVGGGLLVIALMVGLRRG